MSAAIMKSVGPFKSEIAAKAYRETFLIAERQHSITLDATVREDDGGWFVDTVKVPRS